MNNQNWLTDAEKRGAHLLLTLLKWPKRQLPKQMQDYVNSMIEFCIFNIYWVAPIIYEMKDAVFERGIDYLKKNNDCSCQNIKQFSYKDAFEFLKLIHKDDLKTIMDAYNPVSSFTYNYIIEAVQTDDYDSFIEALGNDNHKLLMQYLYLLHFFEVPILPHEVYVCTETSAFCTSWYSLDFLKILAKAILFGKKQYGKKEIKEILSKFIHDNIEYGQGDSEVFIEEFGNVLGDFPFNFVKKRIWENITNIDTPLNQCNFFPHFIKSITEEFPTKAQFENFRRYHIYTNVECYSCFDVLVYMVIERWDDLSKLLGYHKKDYLDFFDCARVLYSGIYENVKQSFREGIVFRTSEIYNLYALAKPILNEQEILIIERYLNSSEYYRWYNSIMSSAKAVPINKDNINSDSLGNRVIGKHVPGFPRGEDKQPIYNFVLKKPLSESELNTLYKCLVDQEFIDMGTPIENLIHVLGGPRPKEYKAVHWIKKSINNKICKKSVLNLMVYLVGNWDDIVSSSTRKDWLNRLNYCFEAGDTPFSSKNLKDSKSYYHNEYNAQSEANEQLKKILGEVFGTDSERYSELDDIKLIIQTPTNNEMA